MADCRQRTTVDERRYLELISGETRGVAAASMRLILSLATPFYRGSVAVRNAMFDVDVRSTQALHVPVISVGNVTTGGTGKTPLVGWLAQWLVSRQHRPCILSRGYRSQDETGNDEYRVLKQLAPDVPHLQNRDRVAAANEAIRRHAADVLILDDGFQHRRLHRDLDIVLVDGLNPWGFGRLLPRGLLREPRASLARADLVIITRADQADLTSRSRLLSEISRWTDAPIAQVAFRPRHLTSLSGQVVSLKSLTGSKSLGFCGIGNPTGFASTLAEAGLSVAAFELFADHYHYRPSDLERLVKQARQVGASNLVTTQKDLVKLEPGWARDLPVWAVVLDVEFLTGQEHIVDCLQCVIAETSPADLE